MGLEAEKSLSEMLDAVDSINDEFITEYYNNCDTDSVVQEQSVDKEPVKEKTNDNKNDDIEMLDQFVDVSEINESIAISEGKEEITTENNIVEEVNEPLEEIKEDSETNLVEESDDLKEESFEVQEEKQPDNELVYEVQEEKKDNKDLKYDLSETDLLTLLKKTNNPDDFFNIIGRD